MSVHAGQPVTWRGAPLAGARLALVMLHGRGSSATSILSLADQLGLDAAVAIAAPQAAGNTWYPLSFLAPFEQNEPHLSSALATVAALVAEIRAQGVPPERIGFVGFSQGACLALEFAVRHAQRFAGVAGLSGGLIGPPGTEWHYPGHFAYTPIFLGISDVDAHVPLERVEQSAAVFRSMQAAVDVRVYPGMGHTINEDELIAVRRLFARE